MSNYVIFTDSACDISASLLQEWGVEFINMTFHFTGDDKEYSNVDMGINEFYNSIREGKDAKTAAINPVTFANAFEKILAQGKDILYLGFSSGMSTTYQSSKLAADEMRARYPERKVITVDTLAASAGQGLTVYLAVEKKKEGATMEEVAAYVESMKLNICHWVTVDDLVYLKRGGRISPTVALVGKALGIKPIIHVDNDGKLISVGKARGRKASLAYLADQYGKLARELQGGKVFISHGDCESDARDLAQMIQRKFGHSLDLLTDIGPVIGAHSGPGTIALFFVGKER